jgi:hypothetical protein
MNWKLVVIGGIAFYIVTFLVSFITGPLIHQGVLDQPYKENAQFWRPELNQDPPDMAALMPRWITTGVITSLIIAALYGFVRPAFQGAGWKRGLLYGLGLAILTCVSLAGYSGVFNLPDKIWLWWGFETFLYYLPAGAVLGVLGERFAS